MKMLVQTIQISFSSYAADTIRIHTGETGREILFVPDMEISGNYSADFIVIKPDDTFVIAAATITEGKINVEIPEQAGAVAGAGHYILKIYDGGNVCIYSASGGFMVDDHLLTDSMIESVAEAYGYRFPQDFAILDDAETSEQTTWSSSKIAEEISEATPDIIDDENVLYDKTWSSEKISYELGNIHPFHVYTTTEQPVGRWIDGKILYERTFELSNPSGVGVISTGQTYDMAFLVSGYYALNDGNSMLSPNQFLAGSNFTYVHIEKDGDIQYRVNGYTATKLCVTIRYTKPTE